MCRCSHKNLSLRIRVPAGTKTPKIFIKLGSLCVTECVLLAKHTLHSWPTSLYMTAPSLFLFVERFIVSHGLRRSTNFYERLRVPTILRTGVCPEVNNRRIREELQPIREVVTSHLRLSCSEKESLRCCVTKCNEANVMNVSGSH